MSEDISFPTLTRSRPPPVPQSNLDADRKVLFELGNWIKSKNHQLTNYESSCLTQRNHHMGWFAVGGVLSFGALSYSFLDLSLLTRKAPQWGTFALHVFAISSIGFAATYWAAKYSGRELIQCFLDCEDKYQPLYRQMRLSMKQFHPNSFKYLTLEKHQNRIPLLLNETEDQLLREHSDKRGG